MRVGIVVHGGGGWLGGRNYIRNLLTAVYNLPGRQIEPVILTTPTGHDQVSDLPPFQVIRSAAFNLDRTSEFARRALTAVFRRNVAVERVLREHKISVLSHSGHLGPRASIAAIGWIPDFQSMHMPEFQTERARADRERRLLRICSNCTKVIVSSESVRNDLIKFAPRYSSRAEVLRFVAAPFAREPVTPFPELIEKYEIDRPFFLLPNQFWAHKNHRTVIGALKVLKEKGRQITVLATGATQDHRNPGHFNSTMEYAKECGVLQDFRVLGLVPYADLAGLMKWTVALINPSLFEGWSTSVEEAKTAGKAIVLSDISVHREQNPERGIFFAPMDAEQLADALLLAQSRFDKAADLEFQERAFEQFPRRQQEFACEYQRIDQSVST